MSQPRFSLSLRWIGFLILLYLIIAGYSLLSLSLPSMQTGITQLDQGERELLDNPAAASKSFSAAATAFEASADRLRQSSLAIKILTPLPPFRWQIRLLKACDALALAGQDASRLVAAYPAHTGEKVSDLTPFLARTGQDYLRWFSNEQGVIQELNSQLDTASGELSGIPPWITFSQREQLEELTQNVQSADTFLHSLIAVSRQLPGWLGANDAQTHSLLILFSKSAPLDPGGGQIAGSALLQAKQGEITNLSFPQDLARLNQENIERQLLPAPPALTAQGAYLPFQDALTQGFMAENGAKLSQLYQQLTGTPVQAVVTVDSQLISRLLALSQNGKSSGESQADNLLSENSLPSFLPDLLSHLLQLPNSLFLLTEQLGRATADKSLQSWSSYALLNTSADQIPSDGNWLKVASFGQNSGVDISLSESSLPLQKRLQEKLTLSFPAAESGRYTLVYLPASTTVDQLPDGSKGEVAQSDTGQKKSIGFWSESGKSYQLTYTLPASSENSNRFTFLSQAGAGAEHLQAFGFNGTVSGDLIRLR